MKQQDIDRNAIAMIVITHFHADHFGGIPFFILDAQFFSKRREPLTIVGPVGFEDWYVRVMETAFPGSSDAAQKFEIRLVEIVAGGSQEIGDVKVSAYQAIHGPQPGPYLAVRVEAEGRSVAYTGDTEWTPELIHAARDADLFIAEAHFRDKAIATHLSLAATEANLDQLRPKRLINYNAQIPGSVDRRHCSARCSIFAMTHRTIHPMIHGRIPMPGHRSASLAMAQNKSLLRRKVPTLNS